MPIALVLLAVVLLAIGLSGSKGNRSRDYLIAAGCVGYLALVLLALPIAWWLLISSLLYGSFRLWRKSDDQLGKLLVGCAIAGWLGLFLAYSL